MSPSDIESLREQIDLLRRCDRDLRVFGSQTHGYRLGPRWSEDELVAFESEHRILLPDDYRLFLRAIGDGGAGPFYGLSPLRDAVQASLSRPFPLTAPMQGAANEAVETPDGDVPDGALELCHLGCAIYTYLVVNGPERGLLWEGREDFRPLRRTFGTWYREWLERSLRRLANAVPAARLRCGMSKGDVMATAPGDWKERITEREPVTRHFGATDIPVQLELDERGIVIATRPWPWL